MILLKTYILLGETTVLRSSIWSRTNTSTDLCPIAVQVDISGSDSSARLMTGKVPLSPSADYNASGLNWMFGRRRCMMRRFRSERNRSVCITFPSSTLLADISSSMYMPTRAEMAAVVSFLSPERRPLVSSRSSLVVDLSLL